MYTKQYWQGLLFFDKMILELSVLFDLLRNNHITQTGNSLILTIEGLKLQQSIQNPDVGKEYILVHREFTSRVLVTHLVGNIVKTTNQDGYRQKLDTRHVGFIDPNKVT